MSANVSNGVVQGLESLIENALKPLDDLSALVDPKELAPRPAEGNWIEEPDFLGCFQYIQIYHDPSKYEHSRFIAVGATQFKELLRKKERSKSEK